MCIQPEQVDVPGLIQLDAQPQPITVVQGERLRLDGTHTLPIQIFRIPDQ